MSSTLPKFQILFISFPTMTKFGVIILLLTILNAAIIIVLAEGLANKNTRLIGAQEATEGEFPHIVSIQRYKKESGVWKHFCAASIVDSKHIVTAAHCVWNKFDVDLKIIAGGLNISAIEEGQQITKVKKINLHPRYTSENRAGPYDIAVLELKPALNFTKLISPIELPNPKEPASGDCTYAGWGNRFLLTGIYYHGSDVLRTVSSTVIPRFQCLFRYLFVFRRQLDTAICTAAGPLRGSCQGDSGGSVICYNKDKTPTLAGVVSWGWFICGDGIHPDVATDVSLFVDFIKGFMKKNKRTPNKKKKPSLKHINQE